MVAREEGLGGTVVDGKLHCRVSWRLFYTAEMTQCPDRRDDEQPRMTPKVRCWVSDSASLGASMGPFRDTVRFQAAIACHRKDILGRIRGEAVRTTDAAAPSSVLRRDLDPWRDGGVVVQQQRLEGLQIVQAVHTSDWEAYNMVEASTLSAFSMLLPCFRRVGTCPHSLSPHRLFSRLDQLPVLSRRRCEAVVSRRHQGWSSSWRKEATKQAFETPSWSWQHCS